jgi:hypothetical protein
MQREEGKGPTDKAKEDAKQREPEFDKPLGSSRNDKVDLRDLAREAAKKSNN